MKKLRPEGSDLRGVHHLQKNTLQIVTLFALGNLWMARHKLLAMGKVRVQRA